MKKTLLLTLLAVLTTALPALAYDFEADGIYYDVLSEGDKTCEVSHNGFGSYTGDIVIPSTVTYDENTYSVTKIGEKAFFECASLTSVAIPNSVTSIGSQAFRECSSLTTVTIPNSVTSIEWGVFEYCTSLATVVIPNTVTSIGDWMFNQCTSLTSVDIPNSVTSIGEWAFYGCSSLTSVVIPNSVTSIGGHAFRECTSLTSVVIPNTVTSIGESAFSHCSSLTSVVIPNSVTSIGGHAFRECTSLTSVVIPNSVETIGRSAFYQCSGLESVTIGESVTTIGEWAFWMCTSLTSVDIPYSVTTIGECAFSECSSLTSFTGKYATDDHRCLIVNGVLISVAPVGLTTYSIPSSVTSIGESAFEKCTSLASVVIPNTVTSIGDYAFNICTSLKSVGIPNSVTSIGKCAFTQCYSLESITGKFTSDDNRCLIVDGVLNSFAPAGLTTYSIPNDVTSIGEWAFINIKSLTSVEIPNSVTSIGDRAFKNCNTMTSVIIPNSVTSIGEWAFINCTNLTQITSLAVTPPTIQSNTFENVSKTATQLNVSAVSVEAYKSAKYWSEFESIITMSVTDVAQLSNEKVYTIKCARDYLGITSEGKMNAVNNKYASAGDDNLFAIYKGDNGYYLYAIRRALFVPTQGTTTNGTTVSALDAPDGYYTIEPYSDATYNGFTLTSSTTGCWMMLGGAYQWLGSDTWDTADAGDIWTIAEYDEVLDPETLNTIAAKVKAYEQCAAPTISFVDGQLVVASETPGAVCYTTVTSDDFNTFVTNDPIEFTGVYNISAYAHAAGYTDSDPVVATLVWVMPEGDATGLTCMEAKKPIVIRSLGGNIIISGTEKLEKVQLYTIAGVQLASVTADGDQTVIPCSVPKGDVVIVKYGNRSVKIVI